MSLPYFQRYENRLPPLTPPLSARREMLWHLFAGLTIGSGAFYLVWRWTSSLNPDAMVFSVMVALAESLCFVGTMIFFHDIWREGDTTTAAPPATRAEAGLMGDGPIHVDLLLTSFNEESDILKPSIAAALQMRIPDGIRLRICLCDDGDRPEMAALAAAHGIDYSRRGRNRGYKAGNLRHAMFRSQCDFLIICDADTRVFPSFLENTLGYFRNPKVAWVQTPHWFYDIPEGREWRDWLTWRFGARVGTWLAPLAPVLREASGRDKVGGDPFLSDPALFFDVIQRRRNRNNASFCCGAASVHRTEVLFQSALARQGRDLMALQRRFRPRWRWGAIRWLRTRGGGAPQSGDGSSLLPAVELQPFCYHVSEDLMTSIKLHSDKCAGWLSVYHPQIESRMLSPWSLDAWAIQKLKYAGGTFDIMLRENPLSCFSWRGGMAWRKRLHYAATFWSYASVLWVPVMLLAPVLALFTGAAPVAAYSAEFFMRLLPVLIFNEIAIATTCKGYNAYHGQAMALTCLPIQLRALWSVLRGRRPTFPTTPKTPMISSSTKRVVPNLMLVALMLAAAVYAVGQYKTGNADFGLPMLSVNLFWLAWNMIGIGRIAVAATWRPAHEPEAPAIMAEIPLAPPSSHNPELCAHVNRP